MKRVINPGDKFGVLTAIRETDEVKWESRVWELVCRCGRHVKIPKSNLFKGNNKSCGQCGYNLEVALKTLNDNRFTEGIRKHDLTGKVFGELTVIGPIKTKDSRKRSFWKCVCTCGRTAIIRTVNLMNGETKSCGKCSYRYDRLSEAIKKYTTHEDVKISKRLHGMKQRCYNKNHKAYQDYGGRGIYICEEWLKDPLSFVKWAKKSGYRDDLEIDRINNDGPYAPWNCRWVTREIQMSNTRTNRLLTVFGITKNLSQWSKILGTDVYSHCLVKNDANLTRVIIDQIIKRGIDVSDYYEQEVSIVSHVDLDGHAAAAVAKRRYPHAKVFFNNYGQDVHPSAFVRGGKMIVTDFSLTEIEMQKCSNLGIDVIWIDHHKSNIERLHKAGYSAAGLQTEERSGAYLTWQFLFPGEAIPEAIKLVDSYDRWVFNIPNTKEFQCGMSMVETRVNFRTCTIWNILLGNDIAAASEKISQIVKIGTSLLMYNQKRYSILCDDLTYSTDWNGKKILIANTKQANSTFFDSCDKTGINALSVIQFVPGIGKYRCSVYSPDDKQEVIDIATSFNGGGHPKACGFQSAVYPFPVPMPMDRPKPLEEAIKSYQKILEMRKDVVVNQSACRSDKISLTSALFTSQFLGINCQAINHPYISELIRTLPSSVDLIDPMDGSAYRMLIGFCMTKYGWYRTACYFTDQSKLPTKEKFLEGVKRMHNEVDDIYVEDLGMLGKVYWFYSKTRPIGLPEKRF